MSDRDADLVDCAIRVRAHAYAPYSKFAVGAAVRMDGQTFEGVNVENASYPMCVCAERNAIAAAVVAGARKLEAVAVCTQASPPSSPCGGCRQVLVEFADDPATVSVIAVNPQGERRVWTLAELLPDNFHARELPDMSREIIFRGATILTIDAQHRVLAGDVACVDGVIAHVGGTYTPQTRDYDVVDCGACVVMPGLVQAHVHTCQTLARGRADDMELLDWLRTVVWPYEAALDEAAASASAELACAELLLGGTTAILDMGTVHHTDALFEGAKTSGIRATIGKAMMDADDPQIPRGLRETTRASLDESARLIQRWHGAAGNRLRYAYAPRFVPSCTDELLREVGVQAKARGVGIHTHASENLGEIELVRARFGGKDNIVVLDELGLLGPHTCIAHCIHLSAAERALLAERGAHVCTCPSSNLKLASGVCGVPELIAAGVSVAIGADGAPCNNNLDGFAELRLTALLHKPRLGPRTLPAAQVVRMATLGGAAALGIADQTGSLEVGKRGDVIAVDVQALHTLPAAAPWSQIAYAAKACDVRHVAVDGALVVRDRALLTLDVERVRARARTAAARLFPLAG